MHLEAELVHAEPGQRIVRVIAYKGGTVLGSSLGEASTAEEAEDRARERVLTQMGAIKEPPLKIPSPISVAGGEPALPALQALPAAPTLPSQEPDQPVTQPDTQPEETVDPEDWSSELARLDLQLKRLGWGRDQEGTYLGRAFGHPSRNRLTNFSDLMAYLQALEPLEPGQDPATAPVPLRRRDLLEQCDQLLGQLQWDASRGRTFLEQHFSLASRQQLNDNQLLEFNMLLEGELISSI